MRFWRRPLQRRGAALKGRQSRAAAQVGPTNFVTTDKAGNLASASFGPADDVRTNPRLKDGYCTSRDLAHSGELRRGVGTTIAETALHLRSWP